MEGLLTYGLLIYGLGLIDGLLIYGGITSASLPNNIYRKWTTKEQYMNFGQIDNTNGKKKEYAFACR